MAFVCCPLVFEFSVGIGGFVIGLGQISFFFSFHFTIKQECKKSLMCAQVYTYAELCSDKNANKKDNSLLDLIGIFSQSLIKCLVSQKINRLPHINFVLLNSCVNILYSKFKVSNFILRLCIFAFSKGTGVFPS